MLETLIVSIASFIGTNIDDMVINMLFFSTVVGRKEIQAIVLGKYLGIGALIMISIIGAIGLNIFPMEYVKYLGLVPIGLGVKALISESEEGDPCIQRSKTSNLMWYVMLITIANGADNLGVYIPLFTGFSYVQSLVCLSTFIFMTGIWCVLGYWAVRRPFVEERMNKYKTILVPLVYISLGIYIMGK